jgi:hypothetical protein
MVRKLLALLSGLLAVSAGAGAASTAEVGIVVSDPAGSPVPDAYVAVVRDDRPWSQPLFETVLTKGHRVTWTVPDGRYRIVAGAPSFELAYGEVLDVAADTSRSIAVSLRPLQPILGRIVTEDGQPIAGARVGTYRSFGSEFALKLSPLGESHLADCFQTRSAEDGAFAFPAVAGYRHSLWVEAEGHEPAEVRDFLFEPPARQTAPTVRLVPGASLRASWRGGPELAGSRIALRRSAALRPVPEVAEALWERPAESGQAAWPSLPSGQYEIWLRGPRQGGHRRTPTRLATVELATGCRETLELQLSAPASIGPATETGPVAESEPVAPARLLLAEEAWLSGPLKVAVWTDQEPADAEWSAELVSGGLLLTLDTPCHDGARYVVSAPGRVAATARGEEESCSKLARLRLQSAVQVQASISAPLGSHLPKIAEFSAERCVIPGMAGAGGRLAELPVRVDQEGTIRASVPAGCIDLRLRAGDFAPLFWPTLHLAPGPERSLGRHELRRGAALLVRVVSARDGRPVDGVSVRAVASARVADAVRAAFERRPSTEGSESEVTREGGWARLYGLEPGSTRLLLRAPGDRWPQVSAPVELYGGDETVIDDLRLRQSGSVVVTLAAQPEVLSALASLELHAVPADEAAFPGAILEAERQEDGRFLLPEILAGSWEAVLVGQLRGNPKGELARQPLEVLGVTSQEESLPLRAALYRGRVSYRGEGIAASISLRPMPWGRGDRPRVVSGEDGAFQLLLGAPGVFLAEVSSQEARLSRAPVPGLRFEHPDQEVEIAVAAGRISGQVVDGDGRPAIGVPVKARQIFEVEGERARPLDRLEATAVTKPDGSFVLEGLAEGPWRLRAEGPAGKSEAQWIEVGAEEEVLGVLLEIREPYLVHGRTLDARGNPVEVVRGTVSMVSAHAGFEDTESWTSDGQGEFSVEAEPGRWANVTLQLRDGTVAALRSVVADPWILEVPSPGEVRLRLRAGRWQDYWPQGLTLVHESGAMLSPFTEAAERPEDALLVLPQLASGRWRLVHLNSVSVLESLRQGREPSEVLASFTVRAGETSDIVVEGFEKDRAARP